jgi:hypothetical protein
VPGGKQVLPVVVGQHPAGGEVMVFLK